MCFIFLDITFVGFTHDVMLNFCAIFWCCCEYKIWKHKTRTKKIIGVSLNSCARAMSQNDKYKNILIFIALTHCSEVEQWNLKFNESCCSSMSTSAINLTTLNFDENNYTSGHQAYNRQKFDSNKSSLK